MSNEAEAARRMMVEQQLRKRGIKSPGVLAAMAKVPRERFIQKISMDEAYADRALTIDCGQTISQPFIVALSTEALELSGTEHVLEVGTGSGYQAAILAELVRRVVSIERHGELSARAREVLTGLGYDNVTFCVADGTRGWLDAAPYDRILVTAAALTCPPALWDQLVEGGIMVIPIGTSENQVLQAKRKVKGKSQSTNLTGCRFVPLISEQGWPE